MLIAVIADTHMPRGRRRLPAACVERLKRAALIIHAGDFVEASVLDELLAVGPKVAAVHGNVDSPEVRRRLPVELRLEAGGASLAVVHDAGTRRGRFERLGRRFPDVDAVVFGHSHIPMHEQRDGFHIFNPGSPTDRRRQPRHTMGMAEIRAGEIEFELIALD